MLTPGEVITAIIRNFVATAQTGDRDLREKCQFFLQEGASKLWSFSPTWWRLADGTVNLTGGDPVGTCPLNFSRFGDEGHVYISGEPGRPALRYKDPVAFAAIAAANTSQAQYPEIYTLYSKAAESGRAKIKVYPTTSGNVVLDLKRYVARAPRLIDIPTAPHVTVGSVVTSGVDDGVHRWRVVFLVSGDTFTTEGGIVSVEKTISSGPKTVALTDIAISPVWAVDKRQIYRTEAGGEEYKLVGEIADNLTTTFTDDVDDGSLGATCPVPATSIGCGLEQFPEDWQQLLMYEYLQAKVAQGQGDVRDQKWFANWEKQALQMWSEEKQGQNFPSVLPRYGKQFRIGRTPSALDRLRNA